MTDTGPDSLGTNVSSTARHRNMSKAVGVILRNAAASWVGYAVNMCVAFLLTPFVLTSLGDIRYGIWSIVVSLTGYYGLLDLGFRSGLTQYLVRYLAVRDYRSMNEAASTGAVLLAACGVLVLLGSLALAALAPRVWTVDAIAYDETRIAIVLVGLGFAVQLTFFVYSAVFNATQRQDLANLIAITTRLATAGATVVVLSNGRGLPALAAVIALGNVFEYALRIPVAYRILPELRIRISQAKLSLARAFGAFGAASVTVQIGSRVIFYSDVLVIGAAMPTAALAPFALAGNLVTYFGDLFIPIGWALSPAFASLSATGESTNLKLLFVEASRIMALVVGVVAVVLAFAADPFFRLWVGPAYLEGNSYGSASQIFIFLLIASAAHAIQRPSHQLFMGAMRPWILAAYIGTEAGLNLLLSLALVKPLGLTGVALGTVVPAVALNAFLLPRAACRLAGTPFSNYIRQVLMRSLAVVALTSSLATALRASVPASSWTSLLLQATLTGIAGVVLAAAVGLSKADRARLIWGPLRRGISGRPVSAPPSM